MRDLEKQKEEVKAALEQREKDAVDQVKVIVDALDQRAKVLHEDKQTREQLHSISDSVLFLQVISNFSIIQSLSPLIHFLVPSLIIYPYSHSSFIHPSSSIYPFNFSLRPIFLPNPVKVQVIANHDVKLLTHDPGCINAEDDIQNSHKIHTKIHTNFN